MLFVFVTSSWQPSCLRIELMGSELGHFKVKVLFLRVERAHRGESMQNAYWGSTWVGTYDNDCTLLTHVGMKTKINNGCILHVLESDNGISSDL